MTKKGMTISKESKAIKMRARMNLLFSLRHRRQAIGEFWRDPPICPKNRLGMTDVDRTVKAKGI